MTTPNRDPADIAGHLAYEVEMFFAMARELSKRSERAGSLGKTYVSTSSDTDDWSDGSSTPERHLLTFA